MDVLTLDELGGEFDEAVFSTRGIDHFCTSTDWVVPAHLALMPPREAAIARDGSIWFAGAQRTLQDGVVLLEPLEASWALASPIVGVDNFAQAQRIARWLDDREGWDVALIAGLLRGSELLENTMRALSNHFRLRLSSETPRYIADLTDGLEAYLGRRSRNFRRALQRARRACERDGVVLTPAHGGPGSAGDLFERILAVERCSWKGRESVGIDDGRMREFYQLMCQRLVANGRLRCWFATLGDRDVGYVLGAVRGTLYRGLQFSYDHELAHLSLGNFMQVTQMSELIDQGVTRYDLGSDAHYKHRWADRVDSSPVVFAFR